MPQSPPQQHPPPMYFDSSGGGGCEEDDQLMQFSSSPIMSPEHGLHPYLTWLPMEISRPMPSSPQWPVWSVPFWNFLDEYDLSHQISHCPAQTDHSAGASVVASGTSYGGNTKSATGKRAANLIEAEIDNLSDPEFMAQGSILLFLFGTGIDILFWKWRCGSPGYSNLITTCKYLMVTISIQQFAAFKMIMRWIMNEEQKTIGAQGKPLKLRMLVVSYLDKYTLSIFFEVHGWEEEMTKQRDNLSKLCSLWPLLEDDHRAENLCIDSARMKLSSDMLVTGNEEHAQNSGSRHCESLLMLDRNNRPHKRMQSPLVLVRSNKPHKRIRGETGNTIEPIDSAKSRAKSEVWKHSRDCESPLTPDRSNGYTKRMESLLMLDTCIMPPKRLRVDNGRASGNIDAVQHCFSEELTKAAKAKGKSKRKSEVWKHFDEREEKDGVRAYCNYCRNHLAADTKTMGTSSLRRHLKSVHNISIASSSKTENLCGGPATSESKTPTPSPQSSPAPVASKPPPAVPQRKKRTDGAKDLAMQEVAAPEACAPGKRIRRRGKLSSSAASGSESAPISASAPRPTPLSTTEVVASIAEMTPTNPGQKGLDNAFSFMKSAKEKEAAQANDFSIKRCISVLNTMDITREEKVKASEVFMNPNYRETFISFNDDDPETALLWLRGKMAQL